MNYNTLSYLLNQNWLDVVARFRTNSIIDSGRTTYGVYLDLSSTYMTVYSGLKLYVYYLFAPFPWQVDSLTGLYAGTESIMRMILIYFSVKQWRKAYGSQRRLLALMLILYFSVTFMWAIGYYKLWYCYEASHVELVDYRNRWCSSADGKIESFLF